MRFEDFLVWLARPDRSCGIHGRDTTSGRCWECDQVAFVTAVARACELYTERDEVRDAF